MRSKPFLTLKAGVPGRGATCENDRFGGDLTIGGVKNEQVSLFATGDARHLLHSNFGTKVHRLRTHCLGERVPIRVRDPWVVVNLTRQDGLPAKCLLLERQGIEKRALSIDGGRQTSWATTYNYKVLHLLIIVIHKNPIRRWDRLM